MDCSPPGSSVHGILQSKGLQRVGRDLVTKQHEGHPSFLSICIVSPECHTCHQIKKKKNQVPLAPQVSVLPVLPNGAHWLNCGLITYNRLLDDC